MPNKINTRNDYFEYVHRDWDKNVGVVGTSLMYKQFRD